MLHSILIYPTYEIHYKSIYLSYPPKKITLFEIIREIQIKNHSKENVDFWQNKERKKVNKVNVYIGVKPNPLDSTESR